MSYLDEPLSESSTPFDLLGFTPPPSLLDQKLSGSSILYDTLSFTPPPSLPPAITMKRTTAVQDPDITHILSKHYDTVTRFKEKKYRLGISKARPNDKKAIIPGFPYIKAAKEHKAEKLWRCIETTTEHELAKDIGGYHPTCLDCFLLLDLYTTNLVHIEIKESTRTAESKLAGLRQRIHVVYPEHRLIRPKLEIILVGLLGHVLDSYKRNESKKKKTHLFLSGIKPKTPIADLISITGDRSLTRRHLSKGGQKYYIATNVEHLVLHGEPKDLEVSAVIIRAREIGEDRVDHLLANMGEYLVAVSFLCHLSPNTAMLSCPV
jgi:hypothetical protein